jgi:transcriptional regulator of acetoin/glycerol metabolism
VTRRQGLLYLDRSTPTELLTSIEAFRKIAEAVHLHLHPSEQRLQILAQRAQGGVRATSLSSFPPWGDEAARLVRALPFLELLARSEAEATRRALADSHWNISDAARQLGVARSTLYRLVRRHGLR